MALTLDLANLHILHWAFSVVLPLLLLIASLVYFFINRSAIKKLLGPVRSLTGDIEKISKRDISNLESINDLFEKTGSQRLKNNFRQMLDDSQSLFEGRWLPDPAQYLNIERLLPEYQANSLSLRPAARLLSLGVFGILISVLLQVQIPGPSWLHPLAIALPPLLIGLACALITGAEAQRTGRLISNNLRSLKTALEKKLPVYDDQAGLALVIDQFLDYDRKMADSLTNFNQTASRLAESEMAEGIRQSVERVLLDSVAPSINLATAALTELAEELEKRQAQGMQDLAAQFAAALTADMAGNLRPVNKEIAQMSALMADVKDYIEYAMRSLETVRQESAALLADARQSLQDMAKSRADLAEDFARADEKLGILVQATKTMAELQQGNEKGLADSLRDLSSQLKQHSEEISRSLTTAVRESEQTRQLSEKQETSAEQYIKSMREQAAAMSQQLNRLNETLAHSLTEFSHESANYVQSTLADFDKNLAELVRRMTQATTEIRDAVDALPAALRQPPKFDA